jgi:uncharacterized protein (UPF0332 family)
MSLAEDLLEQADHLARREKKRPKQASLRRAVSAAYYALFHLLISETVSNWRRADQRADLARAFEHGRMKSASQRVVGLPLAGQNATVVRHLKVVAGAFSQLQQFRHKADYDIAAQWSRTEVLRTIELATEAFRSWRAIRAETAAQDYLLSLLVKERS